MLVPGMSTLWEDTSGCAKQYRFDLAIYLITLLSFSYGIITDLAINAPVNVNNIFDGFHAMDKRY